MYCSRTANIPIHADDDGAWAILSFVPLNGLSFIEATAYQSWIDQDMTYVKGITHRSEAV